jgi:lysophospholipid acyltransferase (LPLAT)-like uncharacterized protein
MKFLIQSINLSDSLEKRIFSMYKIVESCRRRKSRTKLRLPFSKHLVAWLKVVFVRMIKQTKFFFRMKKKIKKEKAGAVFKTICSLPSL